MKILAILKSRGLIACFKINIGGVVWRQRYNVQFSTVRYVIDFVPLLMPNNFEAPTEVLTDQAHQFEREF